jgi:hypothetical protein
MKVKIAHIAAQSCRASTGDKCVMQQGMLQEQRQQQAKSRQPD